MNPAKRKKLYRLQLFKTQEQNIELPINEEEPVKENIQVKENLVQEEVKEEIQEVKLNSKKKKTV